tara:strand:+ start:172 stop:369 length:198 start_codon:yes stop_codon:yes gene_type:complete
MGNNSDGEISSYYGSEYESEEEAEDQPKEEKKPETKSENSDDMLPKDAIESLKADWKIMQAEVNE